MGATCKQYIGRNLVGKNNNFILKKTWNIWKNYLLFHPTNQRPTLGSSSHWISWNCIRERKRERPMEFSSICHDFQVTKPLDSMTFSENRGLKDGWSGCGVSRLVGHKAAQVHESCIGSPVIFPMSIWTSSYCTWFESIWGVDDPILFVSLWYLLPWKYRKSFLFVLCFLFWLYRHVNICTISRPRE